MQKVVRVESFIVELCEIVRGAWYYGDVHSFGGIVCGFFVVTLFYRTLTFECFMARLVFENGYWERHVVQ
jgi:hypothetical protein